MTDPARERFLGLLRSAIDDGALVKLTLGKHRGADGSLHNLFVRPVTLKDGPRLAFLWRHATRDITKNLPRADAFAQLEPLVGRDFLDAHLFTPHQTAQLQGASEGRSRLYVKSAGSVAVASTAHDRPKAQPIAGDAPWLRSLGVTGDDGRPRKDQSAKFRQINRFAEILAPLLAEAFPDRFAAAGAPGGESAPLRIVDMGSGKGYLTFALADLLGARAAVVGVEERPELVALCDRIARECGLANLAFTAGRIADLPSGRRESKLETPNVLIALHACDTATDDAIAAGIAAQAGLIVVAPCCQKELRGQLTAPPVLAGPLRHGIFQERQAEFVTDALRGLLLEWAGYRTKVFEFISTEHTAKNLMIAATRIAGPPRDRDTGAIQALAEFYGIRSQRLAERLGVSLRRDASAGARA